MLCDKNNVCFALEWGRVLSLDDVYHVIDVYGSKDEGI